MELSSEDSFRLNVLLANKPLAIRIDESRFVVYGLSERGEAKIQLNPSGRPEAYLRLVRELISGHVLGSPGGYPIYLRRWTRMGQMRDESLEQLLMLGEPEAVVAAVHAPGLTDELARRAWWAMEDAENARRMLANPAVRDGAMGRVLAHYLVEYLPFESEPEKAMESVRLVLQRDLLNPERRADLWSRSARKPAQLLGFLQALPDELPDIEPERRDAAAMRGQLGGLLAAGDPCAALCERVVSGAGQGFLKTLRLVLAKPPNQDLVTSTFDLIRAYFGALRPEGDPGLPLDALMAEARTFVSAQNPSGAAAACLSAAPELADDIAAMRVLSGVGYGATRAYLVDSTASGSLMRRKLAPVLDVLQGQIDLLRRR
jgi:hypothetical protein